MGCRTSVPLFFGILAIVAQFPLGYFPYCLFVSHEDHPM